MTLQLLYPTWSIKQHKFIIFTPGQWTVILMDAKPGERNLNLPKCLLQETHRIQKWLFVRILNLHWGWQEQVWLFLVVLNFYKITPWDEMFPQGSSALKESVSQSLGSLTAERM